MLEASQLLLGKIDELVQAKSNNKFNYDNIRKISFNIDCINVYLCKDKTYSSIMIKYDELINHKQF